MADADEVERRLRSNYNDAWRKVASSSGKTAQGAEAAYGQAYQALVRAGLAPQIKQKYRRS
jgi:hypothetical protein